MTVISRDGGWWNHEIQAGATHRDLLDTSTVSGDLVAFGQKTKYTLFPVRKSVYGCIE